MEKRNIIQNQKGFTLIEIIAVLVILGILAAVAVPKYMDLQVDARNAAAKSAIAEIKSRYSQLYGKYYLTNGNAPTAVTQLISNTDVVAGLGNFTATVTGSSVTANISITAVDNVTLTPSITDSWTIPSTMTLPTPTTTTTTTAG